jgi:hypothetical protein
LTLLHLFDCQAVFAHRPGAFGITAGLAPALLVVTLAP